MAVIGKDLPVSCVYQQEIACQNRIGMIPWTMPFAIDLDAKAIHGR
jgi:hypothetical protein